MIKPGLQADHRHRICGYAVDLFGDYRSCVEGAGDEAVSESIMYMGLLPVNRSSVDFLSLSDMAAFSHGPTSCI